MMSTRALLVLSLLSLHSFALPSTVLSRRSLVTNANQIEETYDYIIVGGGTAGLAVANRLSENTNTTVLVIEAGSTGEDVIDRILAPAQAYYNGVAGPTSDYDWQYYTSAQDSLNGRSVFWPRGKVLGGSSAVNGAYMTRASEIEYDAWNALQNDSLEDWSWSAVFEAQKRAETFTAPTREVQQIANISFDLSNHGTDGPIHYSYPEEIWNQTNLWTPTMTNLGIAQNLDAYGGSTSGSRISTSCINAANWTRSYSATGYFNSFSYRQNLDVLINQQVTQILFNSSSSGEDVTATGVTFASSASSGTTTVSARREVILSAGVIGSPALLQLSGIGNRAHLEEVGIETIVDLPGVGYHLSDHLSGQIAFSADVEISGDTLRSDDSFASQEVAQWQDGDGGLYSAPNNAIAYITLAQLMNSSSATEDFLAAVRDAQSDEADTYASIPTVQAGFNALYQTELELLNSSVGVAEILMTNTGYGDGSQKTIIIQAATQRPLSRGSVQINSTSAFDSPVIDAGYLKNPTDITIQREALKFARRVAQTAPMSDVITGEIAPGTDVSTDEQIEDWIRRSASTEYHPAGSCSMLPLELGGVVDTQLRVYGTTNLRVIDSSIIPLSFAAHLTDPTYGIAERGSAIILSATSSGESSASESSTASTQNSASASSSPSGLTNAAQSDASVHASSSAFIMSSSTSLIALLSLMLCRLAL